jgi:hypothetical protein
MVMRKDFGLVLLELGLGALFAYIAVAVSRPVGAVGCVLVAAAGLVMYLGSHPRRHQRRDRKRASEIISSASVTFKGHEWGPVPLWTIDLVEPLNMSIDVHAYSETEARRDSAAIGIVAERLRTDGSR